jgi:tetratricopeptide (TPR) repeat protein
MNKLEEAKKHHINGNLEQAEIYYNELLIDEPNNSEVLNLISTLKLTQNKLDEALEIIESAITLDSNKPILHQTKGSVLVQKGNLTQAIESFKKALNENPNLYGSQVALGNIYYFNGDKQKAKHHYEMGCKISSKQAESYIGLAKLYMVEGDVDNALFTLKKVEVSKANQLPIQRMMSILFLEKGMFQDAEVYLEEILKVYQQDVVSSLYLGLAKLQAGDFELADKLIFEFYQNNANTSDGLAAVGLLMFHKSNFQLAIEYLEKAIGTGMVPWSWKEALYEAKVKSGEVQSAIEFYKNLEYVNSKTSVRLGELYQLNGEESNARKEFKKINKNDSYYVSSLLSIARSYITDNKRDKANEAYKKVLKIIPDHSEAKLFEINYLLEINDSKKAFEVIKAINKKVYDDSFNKSINLMHGLLLDEEKRYKEAMGFFNEIQKKEKTQRFKEISEEEIEIVSKLESKLEDGRKDPVFVIGLESTGITLFSNWLKSNKLNVFNDRLVGKGRKDVLSQLVEISLFVDLDDNYERVERKKYFHKAKAANNKLEKGDLIVDCMNVNLFQMAIIKKFFPKAKTILLSRNTPDIWLNQKILNKELIDSSEWNETINQVISMGLNLVQIDFDMWLENDKQTLKLLAGIFAKELNQNGKGEQNHWQRTYFAKDHWKNYQQFLGK